MDVDEESGNFDAQREATSREVPERPAAPLFGVVVPGRPIMTDFRQVEGGKFTKDILKPSEVSEIVFFLVNPMRFPATHGCCLYCSLNRSQWKLVGVVTRDSPSGIFRTSWSGNVALRSSKSITLGVSIENRRTCSNVRTVVRAENDRKDYPQKIAEHLFFFLSSFTRKDVASGVEYLKLPVSALKKWLDDFKAKASRDPSFVFKKH